LDHLVIVATVAIILAFTAYYYVQWS